MATAIQHHDHWKPTQRTMLDYARSIRRLLTDFLVDVQSPSDLYNIAANGRFSMLADEVAHRMVAQAAVRNARSWKYAARQAMRSREIYQALEIEMSGPVGYAVRRMVQENASLIRSIPGDLARRMTKHITERQQSGVRAETISEELRKWLPHIAKSKANLIARTETARAETAFTRARAENLGLTHYQWLSAEDSRVRKSHRLMDKVLVRFDDPPSPEALAHEHSTLGKYNAGAAPNCFTEDTKVVSHSGIKTLWRAPYGGDIIVIEVEGGFRFSATPNHPILSENGWIPAGAIDVGNNLCHLIGAGQSIPKPDVNDGVPTFGDVFKAWSGVARVAKLFGLNFHGDVIDDYIDQISITRDLYLDGNPSVPKSLSHFGLPGSNRRIGEPITRISSHIAGASCASLLDQCAPLVESEVPHPYFIGGRSVSWSYSTDDEISTDDISTDVKMGSNTLLAPLFVNVKARKRISGDNMARPVDRHFLPVSSRGEGIRESVVRTSVSFAERLNTFSGQYGVVRVAKKFVSKYSGHVYTLESGNGCYGVSSTQIIAKNCRCIAAPVVSLEEITWPAKVYRAGRIQRLTKSQFTNLMARAAAA